MAKIPELSLSDRLNHYIDDVQIKHDHRGYLGMSQVGHHCNRYLWLTLHDIYNGSYDRRVKRIFERGEWEEHRIVRDLEAIGATVFDEQQEVSLFDGKVLGHIDGCVSGLEDYPTMLLEIKAINANTWARFKKKPMKEASFLYYTQMQLYMHCLSLEKALFVAVNKDNEQRYWTIVDYDEQHVNEQLARLENIIPRPSPHPVVGGVDWYACKMCSMHEFCHANAPTKISCRSCRHMGSKSCLLGINAHVDIGCEDAWEDITR